MSIISSVLKECTDGRACADPESFVRGGPTLITFLVDEGREDLNSTISGP